MGSIQSFEWVFSCSILDFTEILYGKKEKNNGLEWFVAQYFCMKNKFDCPILEEPYKQKMLTFFVLPPWIALEFFDYSHFYHRFMLSMTFDRLTFKEILQYCCGRQSLPYASMTLLTFGP